MTVTDPAVDLDAILHALANAHRRAIIDALSLHPASISRLARMRGLSLPAIHRHVEILEVAGLVARRKTGRTTFLALRRESLGSLQAWTDRFHLYWGSDKETLANYESYLTTRRHREEVPVPVPGLLGVHR